MTSKEIFQSIVDEINIANKKNQRFYNEGFKDLYGFFYIQKTLPSDKRDLTYNNIMVSLLNLLIDERDKFLSKYKSVTIKSDDYDIEVSE